MSLNQNWDSLEFPTLDLPYDRIQHELSGDPRFVRGNNTFITLGGKLTKRPGLIEIDDTVVEKQPDRLVIYETLESPPKIFLLASLYNPDTTFFEMYYNRLDDSTGWVLMQSSSSRSLDASLYAQEIIISRGLAFIKSYPSPLSSDKLGTAIFDGSGVSPNVRLWGLLGPSTPAAIVGAVTYLPGGINATQTGFSVHSNGTNDQDNFPTAPFDVQIGFEELTVTNVTGTGDVDWTVTRGVNGTQAAEHPLGEPIVWRNFDASAHLVQVNIGWKYTYAFKTTTGQISNRAPLETNPDKLPSLTGPFTNLLPAITVQGDADTTNIPTIVIYRSTDGGGTFYTLEEIDNSGSGDIVYVDDSLESDSGFTDPLPDADLNQALPGPSLNSNSPPPTVLDPDITGVNTPVPSTPLGYYSGRIWFGIGNVLFFSAQEELNVGVPEESFPTGKNGNFIRFQYPIINVMGTIDALYVFTLQATYEITGTNLETFSPRPVFDSVGAPPGHPRAIAGFKDSVAFLTHDFRIAIVQGNNFKCISDPLYTDITDAVGAGAEIDIKYWAELDKEWIVVCAQRGDDTSQSRQWIYDIKKSQQTSQDFWNTPWTIKASACASGRTQESVANRRLLFFVWSEDDEEGRIGRIDATIRTGTDVTFDGSAEGYTMQFDTGLLTVPTGDHVNTLRKPGLVPKVYAITLDRTLFNGDQDPRTYMYMDDFWSDPLELPIADDPARRRLSKGYKTMVYNVNEVCYRIAVRVEKILTKDLFELQCLTITWAPDFGV